jgi:succinyl-CoA synthetase beta subunit
VLLRRENKILTGGNMETMFGAETEGKAIQRFLHHGIYPIHSHEAYLEAIVDARKCLLTGS